MLDFIEKLLTRVIIIFVAPACYTFSLLIDRETAKSYFERMKVYWHEGFGPW